jgi:hypothetical protein
VVQIQAVLNQQPSRGVGLKLNVFKILLFLIEKELIKTFIDVDILGEASQKVVLVPRLLKPLEILGAKVNKVLALVTVVLRELRLD